MYLSRKQARFFHTETARKKGITAEDVREFDQATKGKFKDLPEHVGEGGEKHKKSASDSDSPTVMILMLARHQAEEARKKRKTAK